MTNKKYALFKDGKLIEHSTRGDIYQIWKDCINSETVGMTSLYVSGSSRPEGYSQAVILTHGYEIKEID